MGSMPRATCWLVWDKRIPPGVGFSHAELAWTNLKRAVRMYRYRWSGFMQEDMLRKEERVHPTQKPVALMSWCLDFVPGVRTVLDPWSGSGSTLVACKQRRIHAVGIERDASYCRSIIRRLKSIK